MFIMEAKWKPNETPSSWSTFPADPAFGISLIITVMSLRVSLEPHLIEKLTPILPILPKDLQELVHSHLSPKPTASIPHSLLHRISVWSRSTEGQHALKSLHVQHDYAMISLLAGTTTSPEGKFGTYQPPPDPEDVAAQQKAERKAIVTLVNAILSIGGAAFAAFWAAEKTGWKSEYVGGLTARPICSCSLCLACPIRSIGGYHHCCI